jgi:hypothetical protein
VGTSLGHSKSVVVEEDDAYSMSDRVDDPTSEIASEMKSGFSSKIRLVPSAPGRSMNTEFS